MASREAPERLTSVLLKLSIQTLRPVRAPRNLPCGRCCRGRGRCRDYEYERVSASGLVRCARARRIRRTDDPRSGRRVVETAQLSHISVLANIVASTSGSRPSGMPEALSESHGGRKADRLTFAARRTATAQSTEVD